MSLAVRLLWYLLSYGLFNKHFCCAGDTAQWTNMFILYFESLGYGSTVAQHIPRLSKRSIQKPDVQLVHPDLQLNVTEIEHFFVWIAAAVMLFLQSCP